jgi:hypothetical protein
MSANCGVTVTQVSFLASFADTVVSIYILLTMAGMVWYKIDFQFWV